MDYPCEGFSQLHIDVARFATDDFNPFHDGGKWRRIRGNPFGGPIVLGFQTVTWLTEQLDCFRRQQEDPRRLREMPYLNYRINFASALGPGQAFVLTVKRSRFDGERGVLGNRLVIKSGAGMVIMGQHSRSYRPQICSAWQWPGLPDLIHCQDRSEIGGRWFLKRKFMMTANAKNFLLGCRVEPANYFDELENRVRFPVMFPLSYISCALLERVQRSGYDFEAGPMVYSKHEVSVDLEVAERIRSNDRLHILVAAEEESEDLQRFLCLGLIGNTPLFQAMISLVPLAQIVRALHH